MTYDLIFDTSAIQYIPAYHERIINNCDYVYIPKYVFEREFKDKYHHLVQQNDYQLD